MTIKIMNEFMHGAIWAYSEDGIPRDVPPIITNDPVLQKLDKQSEELYGSYFEFDSHDVPCWFDEERERRNAPRMLAIISQIITRLEAINDGSFSIEDRESAHLKMLIQ